jgi:hypothetical protein
MKKSSVAVVLTAVFVLLPLVLGPMMVVRPVVPAVAAAPGSGGTDRVAVDAESYGAASVAAPVVTSPLDDALARLGPDLAALATSGSRETVLVEVLTTGEPDFGALVESWRATTVRLGGMRTVAVLVRADRLVKLAAHKDVATVLAAGEPASPIGPDVPSGPSQPGQPPAPTGRDPGRDPRTDLWYSRQAFGVPAAEANGFDGSGVIVGIEDSGVDFGHPDLAGTFARVNDASSPYDGYPLVYDDASAARYMTQKGDPTGTNYADSRLTFEAGVPWGQQANATIPLPATRHETVDGSDRTTAVTVTRTITFVNTSRSGRIHYGFHPDNTLDRTEITVEPGVRMTHTLGTVFLVVDEAIAGDYDSVYVDLGTQRPDNSLAATYDFRGFRPARLGKNADPTVSRDLDGDGLADLSGGLVYFISDGRRHIPVLDWLWDADGKVDAKKRIAPPAPGDLVAFYGDFDGGSHGTGVASQIAGQGIIDSRFGNGINIPPGTRATLGDTVVGGVTPGMAPRAKLFATRPLGVPNQWIAMTRGYDGKVGTGDEAQVINNSWGSTTLPTSLQNAQDALSTALNQWTDSPRTLIVVSSGNGGQGYSTISSPSSGSTVFSVGAGIQYGTDDQVEIITDTRQIAIGDPAAFSSRGPDLMGRTGTAVMAVGDAATGAVPTNLVRDRAGHYNGNFAFGRFGGTSQAGPQAVGVAALVIQAYKQATGEFPTWQQARALMQFGADDTDHDAAVQGAGQVNADQATANAAGLYGAQVSSSEWQVGDYRGAHYLDFPNIGRRGATYTKVFTFTNPSDVPVNLRVSSDHLAAIERRNFEVQTTLAEEDRYQYRRPDYLIPLPVPAGTEMVQVRLAQRFDRFCVEDPAGPHGGCGARGTSAYYLRAYAWTDFDEDGVLWTDTNGNGVVDEGELDEPVTPLGADTPDPRTSVELTALGESNLSANSQDLRIRRPLERMGEGLYLALIHRARSDTVPTDTLRFEATYYQHQPWDVLNVDKAVLALAAGASGTVRATVRVPSDAAYGFQQGALRVTSAPGTNAAAGLRAIHAIAGLDPLDVYIDGIRVITAMAFGTISPAAYADVQPGFHRVRVVWSGLPLEFSFVDRQFNFRSGTEYTLCVNSFLDESPLTMVVDGNQAPEPGGSRLRFAHLVSDLGTLDVYADGRLIAAGVNRRDVTRPVTLADGRHTITVTPAGQTDALLTVGPLTLGGDNVTIYAVGEANAGSLQAVQVRAPARAHFPEHVSSIPVALNVGATGDLGTAVEFGGLPKGDAPFDIGRVFGLYDWRGNGTARQGDWRNFFLDVPAGSKLPEGTNFLLHARWPSLPNDLDLLAFGPTPREVDATRQPPVEVVRPGGKTFTVDPTVSGPYDLALIARSQDTSHSVGGTAYSFQTTTGGPDEWLSGPLDEGLHLFSHQNVLYDGRSPGGTPFTSTLGSVVVTPARVRRISPEAGGSVSIAVRASLDLPGLEVRAFGLRETGVFSDVVAAATRQGDLTDVAGTNFYTFTATASGMIDVHLKPNGSWPDYDLDMYLQKAGDDGAFATVATSAGPDANEAVRVIAPADGQYRVAVHGFAVPPGAHYTLTIFNAEGADLTLSDLPSGPLAAGQTTRFTLSWQMPYDQGTRQGIVFIGPTGAPFVIQVPVDLARSRSTLFLPLVVNDL